MYFIRILYYSLASHPEVTAIGLTLVAVAVYLAYRRARAGVRVTRYLIGFIICTVLFVITTSKLYTMYQLRGSISGATNVTYQVRQKWDDYSWNRSTKEMEHTYWVTWTDQNIQEPGTHRVSLSYGKWARLKVGDPIEITYVPRDPEPYVRNDIFDSQGNLVFDYILLLAEVAGGAWFMMQMLRSSNRMKGENSEMNGLPE